MAKVPVVGATGPVGANLVSTYKEQGKEVRALVRPVSLENCLIKRTFFGTLHNPARCIKSHLKIDFPETGIRLRLRTI